MAQAARNERVETSLWHNLSRVLSLRSLDKLGMTFPREASLVKGKRADERWRRDSINQGISLPQFHFPLSTLHFGVAVSLRRRCICNGYGFFETNS